MNLNFKAAFENCNGAIELVQIEHIVNLHGLAAGDMVNYYSVFNRVNPHYSTSKSFRMSAIRIYLPYFACLK